MNGVHDLGGMHGHGPVIIEQNEPLFHFDWERRVMGMAFPIMVAASYSVDEFRQAMERMNPSHYLASSYYEHWLHGFQTLLLEKGIITQEELESGKAALGAKAEPVLTADMVSTVLSTGGSTRMTDEVKPRFKVGDRVRTRNINPPTHTRLPRYARGKVGTVATDRGVFHTPDTIAIGLGQKPQHVYNVSFSAKELWGEGASAQDTVRIDLWDEYLEMA